VQLDIPETAAELAAIPEPPQSLSSPESAPLQQSDDVTFQSLLEDYDAANQRLARVASPLRYKNEIREKPHMESYNRAVFRNGFESVLSKVKIRTPEGRDYVARIRSENVCDIPATLIFSEDINGHTDGQQVFITSALMRSVPDDTNLALVIAHEMAHVIADHINEQNFKKELDRIHKIGAIEGLEF